MNLISYNPTSRFSSNVYDYTMYRPSYPEAVIEYLNKNIGLKNKIVADIGAGTGILTKLVLNNGNKVFAIEPNDKMRNASIDYLKGYSNINFLSSTAENTCLPSDSVDVIFVAQAFHWFNTSEAIHEFYRITRNNSYIVLLWNEIRSESTKLRKGYEDLFSGYSEEYRRIDKSIDEQFLLNIFKPNQIFKAEFDNHCFLDVDQFIGRILSSSFSPDEKDARYANFLFDTKHLFLDNAKSGTLEMKYITLMYYCSVKT